MPPPWRGVALLEGGAFKREVLSAISFINAQIIPEMGSSVVVTVAGQERAKEDDRRDQVQSITAFWRSGSVLFISISGP